MTKDFDDGALIIEGAPATRDWGARQSSSYPARTIKPLASRDGGRLRLSRWTHSLRGRATARGGHESPQFIRRVLAGAPRSGKSVVGASTLNGRRRLGGLLLWRSGAGNSFGSPAVGHRLSAGTEVGPERHDRNGATSEMNVAPDAVAARTPISVFAYPHQLRHEGAHALKYDPISTDSSQRWTRNSKL